MSFFGFDPTGPPGKGIQSRAPGFGSTPDHFAGLSRQDDTGGDDGEDDTLDFEDEYDGLGDKLDEADDALNDDTFANEPATQKGVGKDFDFFGQTAKMSGAQPEPYQSQYQQQPVTASQLQHLAQKPAKTGYERYAEPGYIPQLEANASIWGIKPKGQVQAQAPPSVPQQTAQPATSAVPPPPANRKMMSLEEVEAAMRQQSKKPSPAPPAQVPPGVAPPDMHQGSSLPMAYSGFGSPPHQMSPMPHPGMQQYPGGPPQILQRPTQSEQPGPQPPRSGGQAELPVRGSQPPQMQIRSQHVPSEPAAQLVPRPTPAQHHSGQHHQNNQPRQILQNPNRLSGQGQPIAPQSHPAHAHHGRGPSMQGHMMMSQEQLRNMSEADRAQYLQEEARRLKRNQKIHILSRHNGLMTPQDKNFITRIQLQSLVTATGNTDQDPERAESEDWYYNVTTLMRNMHQTSNQPQQTNQFAQTYLFQTGGRYGSAGRRHPRGGDNHLQRMEQQVQRAVEAAKAKPKNKQLVIEGSLGKISFSNAKTPKPLLNLRRQESSESRPATSGAGRGKLLNTSISDLKETLRNIEAVYITLMDLEDHHRRMPPATKNGNDSDASHQQMEWQQRLQLLNDRLWNELKTKAPIVDDPSVTHPFIAILSHSKGKKALPRVFAQVDDQKRIIIVTLIAYHVNTLDVIRHGALPSGSEPMAPSNRERVDLFAQAVLPSLFGYINEAPLSIIVGLTGILRDRANFPHLLRTKIGTQVLTMFISRAELLRQGLSAEQLRTDRDWTEWGQLYDAIFDRAEPYLMLMFPHPTSQSTHESRLLAGRDEDDYHAWQFLAALGAGASPDQQQRLVLAVKDQVMEAVAEAKARPSDRAQRRLGKANLFLRAIGLDVELLA